jgi:hypothetical protein
MRIKYEYFEWSTIFENYFQHAFKAYQLTVSKLKSNNNSLSDRNYILNI